MNSKIVIGAVGCLALLGACSSTRQSAQTSQAPGTDYSRELARQYHGFAEQQRVEAFDYGSSGFFRGKGDTAARGTVVPPETVGQRFTPRDPSLRPELTSARSRLDAAIANIETIVRATGLTRVGDGGGTRSRRAAVLLPAVLLIAVVVVAVVGRIGGPGRVADHAGEAARAVAPASPPAPTNEPMATTSPRSVSCKPSLRM